MTKATFGDASTTAASNTTFDGSNIDEGCPPSGINNAIRSVVAAAKGALTAVATSGTNTYTATLAPAPDALATNFEYLINFATASTSTTPTLNLNSLGAKTIVQADGSTALVSGDLNGSHKLVYDGTNLRVLNPVKFGGVSSIADATNGGLAFSAASGAVSANLAPSDLLTKTTPTTSDSIVIMDAAASSAAKTATIPKVMAALFSPITISLSGDVALNNTANYFDGPSVAQGTAGTWFVSGTVCLSDSGGLANYQLKLWDGTTIIASAAATSASTAFAVASLSGYIASPAANLRISVKDVTATTGSIRFNGSGNSKDCTITAIRIA